MKVNEIHKAVNVVSIIAEAQQSGRIPKVT
jgi:hypothetical protein